MNVVIFGKGFGKPRQLNMSGPMRHGQLTAAFAMLVSAAGFAGGYWVSSQDRLRRKSGPRSGARRRNLFQQQESIDTIRQANEDTLDALAIRIAQMNARVIRLDALGRRLTGYGRPRRRRV